jgi:hypothetical protein
MQIVYKLWEGSWEDGAVLRDRTQRVFARPENVHARDPEDIGYRQTFQRPHNEPGDCRRKDSAEDDGAQTGGWPGGFRFA